MSPPIMGKGTDKLYITHSEHSGLFGSGLHSAHKGYQAKQEQPRQAQTPFDCCALSSQPFEHPVCARNSDGTGHVFDLVNIIPWLKAHNNKHPITKEPLDPSQLITLHYSRREGSGQLYDPISFKPFTEHSHIVAIATTGNVFLAESVLNVGKDLITDTPFKKSDVITLQNPHGIPPLLPQKTVDSNDSKKVKTTSDQSVTQKKSKDPVPWNISPYSNGLPGASLTSTSIDPSVAKSGAQLVWDEEELMFEDISNPVKGKGKEKDVGKRRAYVRVVTTLGGSLNLELYCEKAPKTCYNFLMLAKKGYYNGCLFHRLVPGFMIQTGDPTGTGAGGESYWSTPFRDEHSLKGAAKHDGRGCLAMANKGANTNGSQFYLTFQPAPHLDQKHTVFGKLVGGEEVLDTLEKLPLKEGTERPSKPVRITEVIIYQDPFEDYKNRLAKKLSKQAQAQQAGHIQPEKTLGDDMNWFGIKVGDTEPAAPPTARGLGVGKYLNMNQKRASAIPVVDDEPKKKRKIGFGDFEGW